MIISAILRQEPPRLPIGRPLFFVLHYCVSPKVSALCSAAPRLFWDRNSQDVTGNGTTTVPPSAFLHIESDRLTVPA